MNFSLLIFITFELLHLWRQDVWCFNLHIFLFHIMVYWAWDGINSLICTQCVLHNYTGSDKACLKTEESKKLPLLCSYSLYTFNEILQVNVGQDQGLFYIHLSHKCPEKAANCASTPLSMNISARTGQLSGIGASPCTSGNLRTRMRGAFGKITV